MLLKGGINLLECIPEAAGSFRIMGFSFEKSRKPRRFTGLWKGSFALFFARAAKKRGVTGETLIQLLERRLDNLIYRILFVPSRAEARQLVSHGLIAVNGHTVNIPSFQVRVGDVVEPYQEESLRKRIQSNLEMLKVRPLPEWLELNRETLAVKVVRLPGKLDAGLPVEESQIVELYSK